MYVRSPTKDHRMNQWVLRYLRTDGDTAYASWLLGQILVLSSFVVVYRETHTRLAFLWKSGSNGSRTLHYRYSFIIDYDWLWIKLLDVTVLLLIIIACFVPTVGIQEAGRCPASSRTPLLTGHPTAKGSECQLSVTAGVIFWRCSDGGGWRDWMHQVCTVCTWRIWVPESSQIKDGVV